MRSRLQLQHAPSAKAAHTHRIPELVKQRGGQTLCQCIGDLVPGGGVAKLHRSVFDDLPQEVVTDINVLGAIMEFWVFGDHNGGLVANVEDGGGQGVDAKFGKELPQPYGFLGGVGPRYILRLCAGQGDGCLFLGASAHSGACQLECVAGHQLAVVNIAGPVCVSISDQC